MTNALLRLEAAAILLIALIAYYLLGYSWGWFAALFLLPDAGMAGYLVNPRAGAWTYNLLHLLALPIALLTLGFFIQSYILLMVSLIWICHIEFDRMLGYGLKLGSFHETHLGWIGKR